MRCCFEKYQHADLHFYSTSSLKTVHSEILSLVMVVDL